MNPILVGVAIGVALTIMVIILFGGAWIWWEDKQEYFIEVARRRMEREAELEKRKNEEVTVGDDGEIAEVKP